MGVLSATLEQRARYQTTNPKNPAYWVERLFGGGSATATGINVGVPEALRVSTILSITRKFGQDVGGAPLPVRRPDPARPKATIDARDHFAWDLLNWQPCPEMAAVDFRSALTGHAVLRGTGYAEIEWNGGMEATALWPLRPDRVRMVRSGVDTRIEGVPEGHLAFIVTLPTGEQRVLLRHQVFVLPGFGSDGLRGYNVVQLMREAIGLTLAAEEHGARFYNNDATPSMALMHPGNPSKTALENLRGSFEKKHRGLSNAHRMAVLEEGITLEKVGMTLQDAQYVATREFAVREFARALDMPISKLAVDQGNKSTSEQEDLDYIKAVVPWAIRWEQRLRLHAITPAPFVAKHTLSYLVRGDLAARAAYYHSMRLDGNMAANDVLALEDMQLSDDPIADDLLVPVNMVPSSAFDENGMTLAQRITLANDMVLRGFDPEAARKSLGLSPLAHSGLVPTALQLDPETSAKLAAKLAGGAQE